jgi:hypothetical protein
MGQRLVILNSTPFIQTDDQLDTSAIYYHWSAYTDSAVVEITNLRDKVKDYYDSLKEHPDNFYYQYVNRVDIFNLACLNAVSGVAPQYEESIKYIESLTNQTYDSSHVNRNDGMIGFTPTDIDHILDWSEGTVDINWVFDENGYPDFDKSTFCYEQLVSSWDVEEFKDAFDKTDSDVEQIKKIRLTTDLYEVPLSESDILYNELPEFWYDPSIDRIYSHIA